MHVQAQKRNCQVAESFNDGNMYFEVHQDEHRLDRRPLRFGKAKAKALLLALQEDADGVRKLLEDYVGAS